MSSEPLLEMFSKPYGLDLRRKHLLETSEGLEGWD